MTNIRARGGIRAKVSTMPCQKSEAAKQLELYKLVAEKQRIKQELKFMEQRIHQLQERLGKINEQIDSTEQKIQALRKEDDGVTPAQKVTPRQQAPEMSNYDTFYIEY